MQWFIWILNSVLISVLLIFVPPLFQKDGVDERAYSEVSDIVQNSPNPSSAEVNVATPSLSSTPTLALVNTQTASQMPESSDWEGYWSWGNNDIYASSSLTIKLISENSFDFEFSSGSGATSDGMVGVAMINGNEAIYNEDSQKIIFSYDNGKINVQTDGVILATFGIGDYVFGEIEPKIPDLVDLGVLENEQEDEIFKGLVKDDYDRFVSYFQYMFEEDDLDNFGARVHSGYMRGIKSDVIVMANDEGTIWAGMVDYDDSSNLIVKYYTNSINVDALPNTIINWMQQNSLNCKVYLLNR